MLFLFLLPLLCLFLHNKNPLSLLLLLHMRLLLLLWHLLLLLLLWHLLLHLLLWEELVLLLQVQGWSESSYSSSPTIPHESSCSSPFVLHLLGVFSLLTRRCCCWGIPAGRRKSSHCWSPKQFWPSCCAPNTPGRSCRGGQLLSLVLQLRTAMYCCCCSYCSSQCTAASGHTVTTVHTPPCGGMAGWRRWLLLRPMYTAH